MQKITILKLLDLITYRHNMPFSRFLLIISTFPFVFCLIFGLLIFKMIKAYNHYYKYKKNPSNHTNKGIQSELNQATGMIRVWTDSKCSCGEKRIPKTTEEAFRLIVE